MPKNNNLGPLLIILFVLVVAVVGYLIRNHSWPGLPWSLGPAPTNFTLITQAPSGEVVKGFPTEYLKIASDAKVLSSAIYSLGDSSGKSKVLTTTYSTKAPISALFAAYVDYLNQNGETIIKTAATSGLSSIEASDSKQSISISIYVDSNEVTQVRVDIRMAGQGASGA